MKIIFWIAFIAFAGAIAYFTAFGLMMAGYSFMVSIFTAVAIWAVLILAVARSQSRKVTSQDGTRQD